MVPAVTEMFWRYQEEETHAGEVADENSNFNIAKKIQQKNSGRQKI